MLLGQNTFPSHPMHPRVSPLSSPCIPPSLRPLCYNTRTHTQNKTPCSLPSLLPVRLLPSLAESLSRGLEKRERQRIRGSVKVLGGCLSKEPGLSAKNIYIYIASGPSCVGQREKETVPIPEVVIHIACIWEVTRLLQQS